MLDAKLFLEEIPRWCPGGPHCALLYHRMFKHAKVTSLKEYHRGIHWGQRQPSPEGSPHVEVSAMGLLTPEMTLDETLALYQEVYWHRREQGEVQCTKDMVGKAHNKILEAIRACLQCRWGSSQLAEPRQISRTSGEAQYHNYMQLPHDHIDFHWAGQWPSRGEALREAREAHWYVLAAAAMLKEHIKSLHQSTSCSWQWCCKWSSSCQHSRSQRHSSSRGWHRSNRRWPSHQRVGGWDGLLCLAQHDPGDESPLRTPAWTRPHEQPLSQWTVCAPWRRIGFPCHPMILVGLLKQ